MKDSITLYFRQGSSDKVYQAAIEPKDNLFVVNFAYGRRGSTLNTGTKTNVPVDHLMARNIFDKLIRDKKAKGYTEGPEGTPYQHSDKEAQVSGVVPQLLNPIEEAQMESYLTDPGWCMQEKFDGKRLLIRKQGTEVLGINRKGLVVGLPESLIRAAIQIPGDYLMDGEAVGEVFHAFDLLELGSSCCRNLPYQERYEGLECLAEASELSNIRLVASIIESSDKEEFLRLLQQHRREGVVFKRLDAVYTAGRPASGGSQVKHKFYATASFLVEGLNPGKRSVALELFNGSSRVAAGNVTIPSNHLVPAQGSVVEVKYLYAFYESGSVYQPSYLGVREDVDPKDCTTAQLKYKASDSEEEQ